MNGILLGTLIALHGILAVGLGVLLNGDLIKAKSLRQFQLYFVSVALTWTVLYLKGPIVQEGWIGTLGYLPFFLSYILLLAAVCLHAGHKAPVRRSLIASALIAFYLALLYCSRSSVIHITDMYQVLALGYCWNLCRLRYERTHNIGDHYLSNFMLLGIITLSARTLYVYVNGNLGSGFVYTAVAFTLVNVGICLSIMASYFLEVKVALEKQANTDSLTGVYNRRYFTSSLEQTHASCKRRNSTYSIIICDIDLFKNVNDTYGHICGDLALIKVARCLDKIKRCEDTLSRYGGEEFVFLLPDTKLEEATKLAERFRRKVADLTIDLGQKSLSLTMSFGVAGVYGMSDPSDVVGDADIALLYAKGDGRNGVYYSDRGVLHSGKTL